MASWMLDSVICAGMVIGAPAVDLAALNELDRLLKTRSSLQTSGAMMGSFWRKAMRVRKTPARVASRQMRLFDNIKLDGLTLAERDKIILAPAQILMQAAGLSVEE